METNIVPSLTRTVFGKIKGPMSQNVFQVSMGDGRLCKATAGASLPFFSKLSGLLLILVSTLTPKGRLAVKNLESLKIDYVNFSQNLPGPGIDLRKLTRDICGPILDDIYVRGLDINVRNHWLAFECLQFLVKQGDGIWGVNKCVRFKDAISSRYLKLHRRSERLLIHLKPFDNSKAGITQGQMEKYVWKQLPNTFGEFGSADVRSHIKWGCPVDRSLVSERAQGIFLSRKSELWLESSAFKIFEETYDPDMDDDEFRTIYPGPGSLLDEGGHLSLK